VFVFSFLKSLLLLDMFAVAWPLLSPANSAARDENGSNTDGYH